MSPPPPLSPSPSPALPIDAVLPELLTALKQHNAIVLRAPTGAGKTTRVPPAILDARLAGGKQVVVLQPRRLAARAAAWRIASERNAPLGGEVGYQVRFEKQASRETKLLVATDGIFVRMLQDDPYLERVGAVVFDEFHERNINSDLALAMVRRVQETVRPDLKIVAMSATLATGPVAEYLGGCPTVESEGRLFPVETTYLKFPPQEPAHILAARGVAEALEKTTGDVLVFLPGVGEIRRTAAELEGLAAQQNLAVMELYGDLPLERQQAVLRKADRRKVVLSTNVAETSVTIEGITGVVDTGLARVLRLESNLGLNQLEVERISRASADQRAGRAGRTAPGVCLRLWSEREQRALVDHDTPEILRVDPAGPLLELLAWGETDVRAFPWLDPPPPAAVEQALALLQRLGAIDGASVTEVGRQMVRLPVHPRIARLLVEGQRHGHAERVALVGALLSERDPFLRGDVAYNRAPAEHWSDSDVLDRVVALEDFERSNRRRSSAGDLDAGAAKFVLRARDQLLRLLKEEKVPPGGRDLSSDEVVLRSVLAGFPDRVARRRDPSGRRGVMLGGRGVRLAERSAVMKADLFVCVDVEEVGKSEALVRQASAIERDWLPAEQIQTTIDVEFDPNRRRVVAWRRTKYADLMLDEAPTNVPAGFDASEILAKAAAEDLDRALSLGDEEQNFLARVRSLRQWMPELELPAFSDDDLRAMLPQLCAGCQSFDDLRRVPVAAILKSALTPAQRQALEREAPERLAVPSGSQITLQYEPGKPPVLAVRIQEIFGLRQTPRVAGGRVPVLLHLLAPNMRPQQVTNDLESFWKNTYPEVRKELRRRYPKHAWPDDPWTATPERRPTRKKR